MTIFEPREIPIHIERPGLIGILLDCYRGVKAALLLKRFENKQQKIEPGRHRAGSASGPLCHLLQTHQIRLGCRDLVRDANGSGRNIRCLNLNPRFGDRFDQLRQILGGEQEINSVPK